MINFFEDEKEQYLPPISHHELSDDEVITELNVLHASIRHKTVILGHHYQQDDIIRYADFTGDSLALAKKAAEIDRPYIVFCGVHFMAETADMLAQAGQQVILPDLKAGCSMADMANRRDIDKAWSYFNKCTQEKIVPVTYINCSADLKAFVGENGGSICTSSNARKIIEWALSQGQKLLFFPDQHLGRNTCHSMGIPVEDMLVYNPNYQNGGLTPEQVKKAKVILWHGFCSVHQGFNAEQIVQIRKNYPKMKVIVHPECSFEVVKQSDMNGSTAHIIDIIKNSQPGSEWAVGTEINLVNRLAQEFPDRKIISLSPYQCLCTTMYRVRPRWLLASMRAIAADRPINVVKVDDSIKQKALLALERMLKIS